MPLLYLEAPPRDGSWPAAGVHTTCWGLRSGKGGASTQNSACLATQNPAARNTEPCILSKNRYTRWRGRLTKAGDAASWPRLSPSTCTPPLPNTGVPHYIAVPPPIYLPIRPLPPNIHPTYDTTPETQTAKRNGGHARRLLASGITVHVYIRLLYEICYSRLHQKPKRDTGDSSLLHYYSQA